MDIKNKLYKNIGIHVIISLFTVEKGTTKVLLIKRTNMPYQNQWALPSGALYNNELIKDGALRELKEKTGIKLKDVSSFKIFDDIDRSPLQRMIGIGFIGIIDSSKVEIITKTSKTSNALWFNLNEIPSLAYDHNNVLLEAINTLKEKIITTDILKSFFPKGFTLPELQQVYESILNIKIDRRNFRKKLLNIIIDTGKEINYLGKKKAKLYIFKENIPNINIF